MSQPPSSLPDMRLPQQVGAQAQRRPEATALVWQGTHTSYEELELRSNRLASLLVDSRCPPGTRVALLVPRSDQAILALLGTLKAGAVCVPIDCDEPVRRIARVLRTADCRWILGGGQAGEQIEDALAEAQLENEPLLGWLDAEPSRNPRAIFELADLDAFPARAPLVSRPPPLAQILYDCGTIGSPKGRSFTHQEISQSVQWGSERFGIDQDSRLSQHAPLHHEAGSFNVFGALGAGAALHIVAPELNLLPDRLARFIRESQLTHWLSTAPALNMLARSDVVREQDFPSLRQMIVAGEELPLATLAYLAQRLPQVSFHDFGPPASAAPQTAPHGGRQLQGADRMDIPRAMLPPRQRTGRRGAPVVAG